MKGNGINKSAQLAVGAGPDVKTMDAEDADAVNQFNAGIDRLVELLRRSGNMAAIVVVSDGKNISSGCAGSVLDISTILGPGFDLISTTVKQAVKNHAG